MKKVIKKKSKARLTRTEIWTAICSKYPLFSYFWIDSCGNNNLSYVNRDRLLHILFYFKIHKTRHLTKEQKERLKMEELNMIERKI